MKIVLGPDGFWCDNVTAQHLWSLGYYGCRPDSQSSCRLLDVEALYLMEKHSIPVYSADGKPLQRENLRSFERIDGRYRVYSEFRDASWIVRSGLNYGVDFVLYKASPDEEHARFAVLIHEADEVLSWRRLLGINRSCVGAKKVPVFQVVVSCYDDY